MACILTGPFGECPDEPREAEHIAKTSKIAWRSLYSLEHCGCSRGSHTSGQAEIAQVLGGQLPKMAAMGRECIERAKPPDGVPLKALV